jgi:hypothetical protein
MYSEKYPPFIGLRKVSLFQTLLNGVDMTSEIVGWFLESVGDGGNIQLDGGLIGARLAR